MAETATPRGRRVLITNDDGVDAEGIAALSRAALAAGCDPLVVAPDRNMSGAGTGIGQFDISEGVALQRVTRDGLPDGATWALQGPPGLAVLSASLGAFGDPPDLVLSGINAGSNVGQSVIHSGTVGAALTAHTFGCAGLAISLAPSDRWRYDTAEVVARAVIGWALDLDRTDLVLNVNVPGLPIAEVRGVEWAHLAPIGHIRVASTGEDGQRIEYGITGGAADEVDRQSDHALLEEGHVTVTALTSVAEQVLRGVALPPL